MYLCHCLLSATASLHNRTSSRPPQTIFLWKPHLEQTQARPKEKPQSGALGRPLSPPAKPVMAMETRPLPGYHIRNSYWSRPGRWDQNNKTTINTGQRDLSVTHRQSHKHTHLLSLLCRAWEQSEQQSELFLSMLKLFIQHVLFWGVSINNYLQLFYTYVSTIYLYIHLYTWSHSSLHFFNNFFKTIFFYFLSRQN